MNLRGVVIGVAIFILTLFVTIYGISVFLPQPVYNDYCPDVRTAEFITSPERCEEAGGYWSSYDYPTPDETKGYCDRDYYCRQDWQNAMEENSKYRFFVSIPLGIVIIVFGSMAFAIEAVGVGLMVGGVGTFVWGSGSYWSYASDIWKFVISFIGLVALIWFAYWFEKRNKKKGFLGKLFGKKKRR